MNAQGLGDAGAEAVGLNESADEGTNVIDSSAIDEIAQSFGAGLAGAHLEVDQMELVAEVGMGVVQILADAHEGEIESVRESDADAALTVFDHALQEEAGNEETEGGDTDQQGDAIEAGESDDAGEAEKCQHDAGAEIVADMAGLAEPGLDEPDAGAGYV